MSTTDDRASVIRYTALWVREVAEMFGTTTRQVNGYIAACHGSVSNANFPVALMRLSTLLEVVDTGVLPTPHGDKTAVGSALDKWTVESELGRITRALTPYMVARYHVGALTLGKDLKREVGALGSLDARGLLRRVRAQIDLCIEWEEVRADRRLLTATKRGDGSPEWAYLHMVYVDTLSALSRSHDVPLPHINSALYAKRGSVYDETVTGLRERLELAHSMFDPGYVAGSGPATLV